MLILLVCRLVKQLANSLRRGGTCLLQVIIVLEGKHFVINKITRARCYYKDVDIFMCT